MTAYVVGAAVCLEPRGQRNGRSQEEDSVEQVDHYHDDRMASQAVIPGRRKQIEERDQGEGGGEHGIVDGRRVARKGLGDDVADERHHNDGEDELSRSVLLSHIVSQVRHSYLQPPEGQTKYSHRHVNRSYQVEKSTRRLLPRQKQKKRKRTD